MMKKNSLAPLLFAVALLLGACGKNPNTAVTFGPSSKTSPSGYFFTMTLSQTVISAGTSSPTIIVTVHVYTESGAAPGVPVFVLLTGDFTAPSTAPTTDPNTGLVKFVITLNSTVPGSSLIANATVEDQSVQGKFQIQD